MSKFPFLFFFLTFAACTEVVEPSSEPPAPPTVTVQPAPEGAPKEEPPNPCKNLDPWHQVDCGFRAPERGDDPWEVQQKKEYRVPLDIKVRMDG